jgi:hypothetical protein
MDSLLSWFRTKFARTNYRMVHVLKSLAYFAEAEQDPMPHMLASLSWDDVKQYFASEAASSSNFNQAGFSQDSGFFFAAKTQDGILPSRSYRSCLYRLISKLIWCKGSRSSRRCWA